MLLVGNRRASDRFLEIFPEERLVREMQDLADFLDGVVAALEHCLGILDDKVADPVFRMFP